jgi:hypothetical protein
MRPLSQIWISIQEHLFPQIEEALGELTEKQKRLIAFLELARIEEFVRISNAIRGRDPRNRRALGRVPIIDSNPRRGEKIEMDPAAKERYKERTAIEQVFCRLKKEFGGNQVRVRDPAKVITHLLFGMLALTAGQLLRLVM